MTRPRVRLEKRLSGGRAPMLVVPLVSLVVAHLLVAVLLVATGHPPIETFRRIYGAAFVDEGALRDTLIAASPLAFTGLAAAVAFRMKLFNIGAEGQLYLGAVGAAGVAIWLGPHSTVLQVILMCGAGALFGAVWGAIPGLLRAFLKTNEIITSLMLNYCAGLVLTYLIFESQSYWRDDTATGKIFPQGKPLPEEASWPVVPIGPLDVPLGFLVAIGVALVIWVLYTRTRFGFEAQVIGDSPRAARYAGMRTRRKIVAIMCLSGAVAGLGGASQDGDFRHLLDSRGLQQAYYGYTGIVVAALARYNPFAVVVVAVLLGGLQNAGFVLQSDEFPSGLVGVIQGTILFCMLGGEILVRYRLRLARPAAGGKPVEAGS